MGTTCSCNYNNYETSIVDTESPLARTSLIPDCHGAPGTAFSISMMKAGSDGDEDSEEGAFNRDVRILGPGAMAPGSNKTNHFRLSWMKAVESCDNRTLKLLFKLHHKRVNFIKITWEDGDNSLHKAAQLNNIKLARFLLLLKIDINANSRKSGQTALHYAVLQNHEHMVKLLLQFKFCDPSVRNAQGLTALQLAQAARTNMKIEKLLLVQSVHASRECTPDPFCSTGTACDTNILPKRKSVSWADQEGGDLVDSSSYDSRRESCGDTASIGNSSFVSGVAGVAGVPGVAGCFESIGGMSVSYSYGNAKIVEETDATSPIMEGSNIRIARTEANATLDLGNSVTAGSSPGFGSSGVGRAHVEMKEKLERKQSKFPHNFKECWVVVCRPYVLWSARDVDVTKQDVRKEKTRLKFDGYISISAVEKLESLKKDQFVIKVRNAHHVHVTDKSGKKMKALRKSKEKVYTFRCPNENARDRWIRQLNRYIDDSMHDALLELYQTGL